MKKNIKTKETTVYQIYELHLLNGEILFLSERYDLPSEDGFVGEYEKADDNHMFTISDLLFGPIYVPKKSILYIKAGDIKEV